MADEPSIYVLEARRRLIAELDRGHDLVARYAAGKWDTAFEVVALAKTLEELGWEPKASQESREMVAGILSDFGYFTEAGAIRRGEYDHVVLKHFQ